MNFEEIECHLCSSRSHSSVGDDNAVNIGLPNPPFACSVVGMRYWWLTGHSPYVRLWSRYHYYQHNLFSLCSAHAEDRRPHSPYVHWSLPEEETSQIEDIQLLLYRLSLLFSRPNTVPKLCSDLWSTSKNRKSHAFNDYLYLTVFFTV